MNQSEFPYLEEFKKRFKVDKETVFAYAGNIYSNKEPPPDILVHEMVHLRRQEKIGADKWIQRYLDDEKFRLDEEVIAFKAQINHFKDRNYRLRSRIMCARALSENYGLNNLDAMKILA